MKQSIYRDISLVETSMFMKNSKQKLDLIKKYGYHCELYLSGRNNNYENKNKRFKDLVTPQVINFYPFIVCPILLRNLHANYGRFLNYYFFT